MTSMSRLYLWQHELTHAAWLPALSFVCASCCLTKAAINSFSTCLHAPHSVGRDTLGGVRFCACSLSDQLIMFQDPGCLKGRLAEESNLAAPHVVEAGCRCRLYSSAHYAESECAGLAMFHSKLPNPPVPSHIMSLNHIEIQPSLHWLSLCYNRSVVFCVACLWPNINLPSGCCDVGLTETYHKW